MMNKSIAFLVAIVVFLSVSSAVAANRAALVIGNADYTASPLANPVNDAVDMAALLRKLGFDVILKKNADKSEMVDALRSFARKLSSAEIGLFYYAGHGMQIDGTNYLIPVRCNIREESEVEFEALDAGRVLSKMKRAGNAMNIVILDACRDNPFERSFRTSTKGLAKMDAPPGTVIAYATSPGSVAADGKGRNGTYTAALLKYMQAPHLDVQKMFNSAGLAVMEKTRQKQVPWLSTTPFPDYYLAGGLPASSRIAAKLFVTTEPADCTVRILNIQPSFYNGMILEKGRYHLEVSKKGYQVRTRWITVDSSRDIDVSVSLEKSGPNPGDTWTEPTTGMTFVWVPGGCFMMGQTESEKAYLIRERGREEYDKYYKRELPRHKVCVDGFWMGQKEVTRGQFRKFIQASGYRTDADKKGSAYIFVSGKGWQLEKGYNWEKTGYDQTDVHPVVNVSWNDARLMIEWMNRQSGQSFELPSEVQWEYAARAGTQTMWFWGDDEKQACQYANAADKGSNWSIAFPCSDGYEFTAPTGHYQPNLFGLYDMLGNVWEWCRDNFDSNAYEKHGMNNPLITNNGSSRVVRGGGWDIIPAGVRAAFRHGDSADYRVADGGFRLCLPAVRQ